MPPKRKTAASTGRAKRGRAAKAAEAAVEAEAEPAPAEQQPRARRARKGSEDAGSPARKASKGGKAAKPQEERKGEEAEAMEVEEQTAQGKAKRTAHPTVRDVKSDRLTGIADAHWAPGCEPGPFEPALVEQIYADELRGMQLARVVMLDLSCYLERYLWPHWAEGSSSEAHTMSVVLLVNEKFREGVAVWETLRGAPERFAAVFAAATALLSAGSGSWPERTALLRFLVNCFQSLEEPMVRASVLRLVSLSLWGALSEARLLDEFEAYPQLERHWQQLQSREHGLVLPGLIDGFVATVAAADADAADADVVAYCERFVEFLCDLLSQLPTRRFLRAVVVDRNVAVCCRQSALGARLAKQLDQLEYYVYFPINDQTGKALSEDDVLALHYERMQEVQAVLFQKHADALRDVALGGIANVSTREALLEHFGLLEEEHLRRVVADLSLLPPAGAAAADKAMLLEIVVARLARRPSQLEDINALSLYPTEQLLWNDDLVPLGQYSGESVLALPKLNLQFLTLYDYLLRSFQLFRLESTYEIREDVTNAIRRTKPALQNGGTAFTGWAKMATPVHALRVTEVQAPRLGETKPAAVSASVTIDVGGNDARVKQEWDSLREHDVVFLVAIDASAAVPAASSRGPGNGPGNGPSSGGGGGGGGGGGEEDNSFPVRYGVTAVRGAEVVAVDDEAGNCISERFGKAAGAAPRGNRRVLRVLLDSAQYNTDRGTDVYDRINLVVRRRGKENNFKAVLETIRDLMNRNSGVPAWLHDLFLGYGDPRSAHYSQLPTRPPVLDFDDTFVSREHLQASFPDAAQVRVEGGAEGSSYRLRFEDDGAVVVATAYRRTSPGPYPEVQRRRNAVPFTPMQVEAIRSGLNPGLSLVVGPPGTGKTDVAVQTIANLYHSFPGQRIVLVTHSNQALNDLFQKLMERDIDERHLLRLGSGERDLATDKDFGKSGRVEYTLARRLYLLGRVQQLAASLGVAGDVGYTCETAEFFRLAHVVARVEKFRAAGSPVDQFPFAAFFADAPQPVADLDAIEGCFAYLDGVFEELADYRGFELLRTHRQRCDYLLTTQTRIIAMTCTHAALGRSNFLKLDFKYDSLVMEEAAQILEVETFIPMLLQRSGAGLKRIMLIGDHHQLPPVVKNMAFQKYGHLDQSLFARFVRLGVPSVTLDRQGRARQAIADLYTWRYQGLGHLPRLQQLPEYALANAGMRHTFQFVDVQDFQGAGESAPAPHFFQNLGEAEYVVATYQYLRLAGYAAAEISVLATYNGQKDLITDVLRRRCQPYPCFGMPHKVSTVDQFQGQQNNVVLLSLVRTRAVGHLRDVRRLVVAMSRARHGLYVFGRRALFENCYELKPTFDQLLARPTKLQLVLGERRGAVARGQDDDVAAASVTEIADVAAMGALVAQQTPRF